MAADYPTNATTFTAKTDLVDTVFAAHINKLQDEVAAVETTLSGPAPSTNILTSTYDGVSHTLPSSSWSNVAARLNNIERGLINGVSGAPYVKTNIASTVSVSSGVSLTLQKNSNNSSDLLQAISGGNTNFKINSNGLPYVGSYDVLYSGPNSTSYQNIVNNISSNTAAINNTIHPMLLAGL